MSSITVNGVTYSGNTVCIQNGRIIVDGQEVTPKEAKEINIVVNGNIERIEADACKTISVTGDAKDVKTLSGDVIISGNINGSVHTTSGDVDCDGNIMGSVSTMSGNIKSRK